MFRLIKKGKERGDCTAPYEVELDKEYTVLEFIQTVLSNNPNEWGYIGIKSNDKDGIIFGKPKCEYSYGKILGGIETLPLLFLEFLNDKVLSVSADGGWSRMDYLLEVQE